MDINRVSKRKPTIGDVLRSERAKTGWIKAHKDAGREKLAEHAEHLAECEVALKREDIAAAMAALIEAVEARYAAAIPVIGNLEQVARGMSDKPNSKTKKKAIALYRKHQSSSTSAFNKLLLDHGIKATTDQLKKWHAKAQKTDDDED